MTRVNPTTSAFIFKGVRMLQDDILNKLTEKEHLPTIEELKTAFPLDQSFPTDSKEFPWINPKYTRFHHEHHNYQVYTVEFIDSLAAYLRDRLRIYSKGIGQLTILEVGAGDGRLTRFLKNKFLTDGTEVDIIATDSKDWEDRSLTNSSGDVEILSYLEALKKYQPEIVISCWMNINVNWTADFRNTPSVNEYLLIGDVFRTAKYGEGWYLPPQSDFECQKLTRDLSGNRTGIIQGSIGRFDGSPFNLESRSEVYSFIRNTE